MNAPVLERQRSNATRLSIVDCDIHPAPRTPDELTSYLPKAWREHLKTYGARGPQPHLASGHYPRITRGGARRDATPPDGGRPGTSLPFMREQLLDLYGVDHGILHPFAPVGGGSALNQDLGNALCRAVNEWQLAHWVRPEPRLHGSLVVPQEDAAAAVAEIEHWAAEPGFAQVTMHARTTEPLGRRRYWPIFEAAVRHGKPIALHSTGYGEHANSGAGWMSFYIEEHHSYAHTMQGVIISMIMEGVFERFPTLRLALVEGGFAWVPALAWRLDKVWAKMRDETPAVKRPPSEYMREHLWYSTQPIEEPENPADLLDTIRWIGADRLLFATDYPHWDFDDPRYIFKARVAEADQRAIFGENAKKLYGLS